MTEEDKNNLLKKLKTEIVNIEFEKADGTIRKMKATLLEKYTKSNSDELNIEKPFIPIWDVDKSNWRSFRWDRMVNYNV